MQRISHENKRLKKEVGTLRKQLARIDLDKFSQVSDIIDERYKNDEKSDQGQDLLDALKAEWKCRKCEEGFLEIIIYTKQGIPYYFRKCSNRFCTQRTLSKPHTSHVKGIRKFNKNG